MLSLFGIFLAIALFIILSYKGLNTAFIAVFCAFIVAITGQLSPITALTDNFMTSAAGFLKAMYLIFLFSCLFGRIMGDSGAALSIAKKVARLVRHVKNPVRQKYVALLLMSLIHAILTYGGVNPFVCVFFMVALGRSVLKELDIPWHLYVTGVLGSSTITIGFMPGSPNNQNLIPMGFLGTDTMAGAALGIFCSILLLVLGLVYIWWILNRCLKKGETFMDSGYLIDKENLVSIELENEWPLWKCLLPIVVVLVTLNGLKWHPIVALLCGTIAGIIVYGPKTFKYRSLLETTVPQATGTIILVACTAGFGGVVSAAPGFGFITERLASLGYNAITIVLITTICAGICGSGASGETVALQTFSEQFLATGIAPSTIHRLVAASCCGLDTLPHNAGVIVSNASTKLTHNNSYIHFFFLSVVNTTIVSIIAGLLVQAGVF